MVFLAFLNVECDVCGCERIPSLVFHHVPSLHEIRLRVLHPPSHPRCIEHEHERRDSAAWKAAGLGVSRAQPTETLNRLMFVQLGFGVDQHGDRALGSTKAAARALRDAISFNSIPAMVSHVPGGRKNMLIHVKLGVPPDYPEVDVDELAKVFPYGKLLPIEVVTGGLTFGSGRVVPELGDEDDTAIVAVAAVSLGYHEHVPFPPAAMGHARRALTPRATSNPMKESLCVSRVWTLTVSRNKIRVARNHSTPNIHPSARAR